MGITMFISWGKRVVMGRENGVVGCGELGSFPHLQFSVLSSPQLLLGKLVGFLGVGLMK